VTGGTPPLSFQWRFNSVPIPGATASAYTRTNSQRADQGNYSLLVTNIAGSLLSSNAFLTVPFGSTVGVVSSSPNPALPAQPVVFTFSVSAVLPASGTPTGLAQFRIDGTPAGIASLNSGVACYTNSTLSHGSHAVVAEYAGDSNFTGSTNALSSAQFMNTAPIAGADVIQRDPTDGTQVFISTLLSNDTDPDADPITFTGVAASSANGGTVLSNNGSVFYYPPFAFTNTDSFTYTIGDGWSAPVTGLVTVNVRFDSGPPPNLSLLPRDLGSWKILGAGLQGRTYRILFSDGLLTNWQQLGSATADGLGSFQLIDTNGGARRFYRSVYP